MRGLSFLFLALGVLVWSGGCTPRPVSDWYGLRLALESLNGAEVRSVYFNGPAQMRVLEASPAWLRAEDRDVKSERVRSMAQAVQSPKLFRQLDRQERFDVLLISGDPIQSKPLLDHLLETRDWSLWWVDAQGYVFRRGMEGELTMERLRGLMARWEGEPKRQRAELLASLSRNLVAVKRAEAGREIFEQALKVDPESAAAWAAEGMYRLSRGEHGKAVEAANRALKFEKDSLAAKSVKAQGLYFSNRFAEAYEVSRELLKRSPEDPVMLFAHAKIAHEVRALQEEITVLEKLIGIAETVGRPTSIYRVYLGQAYAMRGEAEGAIRELEAAVGDAELPGEHRDFALDMLRRIRSKVGGSVSK